MRHPALPQLPFLPLNAESVKEFDALLLAALNEDAARSDITSQALLDDAARVTGTIVLRSRGVLAGLPIVARLYALLDPRVRVLPLALDGAMLSSGTPAASLGGPARSVLNGERVALNFLGRMSGVATLTRAYVAAVSGTKAHIADTRKTTPLLRALERYAVRAGGGVNHRFDLSRAVLIKDNHLAACGSLSQAVARARQHCGGQTMIEVECDSLGQVREALACDVDAILLDNMPVPDIRSAVEWAKGRAVVEASGGISLQNARTIALTGVDVLSVGALTHGTRSLDVALDLQ